MFTARAVLAITIALSVQNTTLAEKEPKKADTPPPKIEQKVERRSVSARVESAVGKGTGIRAEKVPGEFTIPKGMTATNFKYRFHDPKSKTRLDKLTASSIYSITEKRYIAEAASGPNFELPPGKYKFVVGGRPGAYGSLSFDMAPGEVSRDVEDLEKDADRIIEVVTWLPGGEEGKGAATYYVHGNQVVGKLDQTVPGNATNEPQRHLGTFKGTISGNTITGVWKIEMLPCKSFFSGPHGRYQRVCSAQMTHNTNTILKNDGTVTETMTGTSVLHSKWGPNAPEQIAGKADTTTANFSIPGEYHPEPGIGTWKDRK